MKVLKYFIGDIINSQGQKYLFINTNFFVDRENKAFLVGSVYSLLRKIQPNLTSIYGKILNEEKFGVQFICDINDCHLYSFPTRYHWKDSTNLKVFRKSCAEIVNLISNECFKKEIPLYIPIILQNIGYKKINFDVLIEQASNFFGNIDNIFLIPTIGNLN